MPVITHFPTTDTPVTGTWTGTANVQMADGFSAATRLSLAETSAIRQQGGYGFDADLPPLLQVNAVTLEVRHRVSETVRVALIDSYVQVNGADGPIYSDEAEPTSYVTRTYALTRPGGGSWTRGDLLDGVFTTRLRARLNPDILEFRTTESGYGRLTEDGNVRVSERTEDIFLLRATESGAVRRTVLDDDRVIEDEFVSVLFEWDYVAVTLDYTDLTPPQLVSTSPASGSVSVPIATAFALTFNEPVARGTGTLTLRKLTGQVVETFNVTSSNRVVVSGTTVTVTPTVALDGGTSYVLVVPAGTITDLDGNAYSGIADYTITTSGDVVSPYVLVYEPSVGQTEVPRTTQIRLTFNEAIVRGTGTITLRTSTGTVVQTFNVATASQLVVVNNLVTISPSVQLGYNTTYFLDIPVGAFKDVVGNNYAGTTTYSFTAESQPLAIIDFDPDNGSTDVSRTTNLTLTFNMPVTRGTGNLALFAAPNTLVEMFNVATSPRVTVTGAVVTIDPTTTLDYGRVYVLAIPYGTFTDQAGNAFIGSASYTFSTVSLSGPGSVLEGFMPGTIPNTGFWVAMTDPMATTNPGIPVRLDPAPSKVEYPDAPLGEVIETADGRVVMQQPNSDPRRRGWIWSNYGPMIATYERQFRWLEGLRSRIRQAAGQSPYIWVYDGTTNLLSKRNAGLNKVTVSSVLSSPGQTSRNLLTVSDFSSIVHPDTLKNATVDIYVGTETTARQRVSVIGATANTLVVYPEVDASLTTNLKATVTWLEPTWWRARVLDTTRTPLEAGNMRYAESKFVFVIEDANWTEVG